MAQGRSIVGREDELRMLGSLLETGAAPFVVLIRADPGGGKSTLWDAATEMARRQGMRVLRAQPNEAEAQLSLAVLSDLLEDVEEDVFEALPPPQRRALGVTLLHLEPGQRPPDQRTVAVALGRVLRELARSKPVVIALDDVQWLDAASATLLGFAARRLVDEPVSFLLTMRRGFGMSPLLDVLERRELETVELTGLTLGAVRAMLRERLDVTLPRWALRRLHSSTGGNPLFAIEVGRVLAQRGLPDLTDPWPVPDAVQMMVEQRVADLPSPTRTLLLAAALLARPDVETLRDAGAAALEDDVQAAVRAGVARVTGGELVFAHPLHAAAVIRIASTAERSAMHRRLAHAARSAEERARHLALGVPAPSEEAASVVARAARETFSRGAPVGAAELARHALRLTPSSSPDRPERFLALCEYMMVAGDATEAHELLSAELDALPRGEWRARAHVLLADGRVTLAELRDHFAHLEQAARHGRGIPDVEAVALARKAHFTAVALVERIPETGTWAAHAVALARAAGPPVEWEARHALAWSRVLRGEPIEDLLAEERARPEASEIIRSVARVQAEQHACRGEIHRARALHSELAARAEARGEEWSLAWLRMTRCELEIRAGEWAAAAKILETWARDPDDSLSLEPARARCAAFVAAVRGEFDACADLCREALLVEPVWNRFEVMRARSLSALLAGNPAESVSVLSPMWAHLEREGVGEVGVFPIAPDLVDAFVALNAPRDSQAIVDRLQDVEKGHPWAAASAIRCDATLRLATGDYTQQTAQELRGAADELDRMGLRFDHARALLALGRAERRLRQRAAARATLDEAAAAFDVHGAAGWARLARSELQRISGRGRAATGLTPSQQRVVELAREGLSNKEIAARLVVSVHTVEVHLSHAYRKLGVRSRSQLARRLAPIAAADLKD